MISGCWPDSSYMKQQVACDDIFFLSIEITEYLVTIVMELFLCPTSMLFFKVAFHALILVYDILDGCLLLIT